ncbi:hypothetical protein ThrDRAFT_00423 [Frankia casuarinae]|nr:hypothetical protein ThrDRAFT_00423 [Frankia casuarinae]KDA44677.1 hypothetical protein BMG523Draft_00527 [Frankia sp. BMG5.23]OAA28405.1 hypothetical protein AAY23_101926 [Frankia casuarinae]
MALPDIADVGLRLRSYGASRTGRRAAAAAGQDDKEAIPDREGT